MLEPLPSGNTPIVRLNTRIVDHATTVGAHKQKDCLERPRAKGAKWTGRDIQADEVIQEVKMGWDAKRDRWNGYDAREYRAVVDEYNEMEQLRRTMQQMRCAEIWGWEFSRSPWGTRRFLPTGAEAVPCPRSL